jgi:hypothetical protein
VVSIKDVYGRTHRVRQSDLSGDADRISTIRANGEVVTGEEIPRSIIKAEAAPAAQRLDHGELNIPGRTKNIDAELDRHKAEQAKEAKSKAKQNADQKRRDKLKAKELFKEHGEAIFSKFGEKFGAKDLRAELESMVKWEPA